MKQILLVSVVAVMFGTWQFAYANVIDLQPSSYLWPVEENVPPPFNGVWAGLGQSFTGQDPNTIFGFHVNNCPATSSHDSAFGIYSGDEKFSNLPRQRVVKLNAGNVP